MKGEGLPILFSREVRRVHCVGVGGMGVAPLAVYLAQLGFMVTGEDDGLTEDVRGLLAREGVGVRGIPDDCELVVYSSAIAKTHPAYGAAIARGLPLVRRGEMLAEIVREKKLVAICGSHGKTTTTALLITALREAGFPAGYVLGGLFADDTVPARAGANDWVVAEIDESDGTIERFSPELTVCVNLDWDHPDQYRTRADLERTFRALFARTTGAVLVNEACGRSGRVVGRGGKERVEGDEASRADETGERRAEAAPYFAFGRTGDFSGVIASEEAERMTLALGGRFSVAEAVVRARGEFNAGNATAALAAAQLMGVELAPGLLGAFAGVRRRQSVLYAAGGVTVIEDYAHHPAEIRALLGSLRRRVEGENSFARARSDEGGGVREGSRSGEKDGAFDHAQSDEGARGRLVVVFQPHRFSRTAQFKAEFAAALGVADRLHLLDVYPAGEAPIAGGMTADIYAELKREAPALSVSYFSADEAEFLRGLTREVRAGDLVVFVGAGDIDRKARAWIDSLKASAMNAKTWDEFADGLRTKLSEETRLRREEPLAVKTTLRVGGTARVYAEPAGVADLQTLVREAAAKRVDVYSLGRGSNLIVRDEGVDGLVISLANPAWANFEPREKGRVWVGAGLRLKNLCGLAAKAGLTGFEFLEGIPGSVGGALRMNAGAMGGWMFDVVEAVEVVTMDGELKTYERAAMQVEYRYCAELQDAIAVGALLRPMAQVDTDAVNRQIDVYRRKRQESQPREPSAGCIFKNPPGNSAGRLIDESGLKGERVGDAEVSAVHANFIVNRGKATGADVLELVRRVRARVQQVKGVELEPEVLLYGGEWREVL